MGLRFEDPPEPTNTIKRYNTERAELIANSGRWAVIKESPGKTDNLRIMAHKIRASSGAWRGHQWDAVVRKQNGVAKLYVRHLASLQEGR